MTKGRTAPQGLAAITGPDAHGPDQDVLAALAAPLDSLGIDVVSGPAAALPTPDRPRVASLQGMHLTGRDGAASRERAGSWDPHEEWRE